MVGAELPAGELACTVAAGAWGGMLERVISGGQTGADQAAWPAAKAAGIPTGGAMPKGFLTEDGPRPELAELYGAHELEAPDYPARTVANVEGATGAIQTRGDRGHLPQGGVSPFQAR
jgi:hypothetical protein